MEKVFLKITGKLVVVLLSGACTMSVFAEEQATPSVNDAGARIRLFGQNGVGLVLYKDAVCTAKYGEKIRVSGSLGNAFGSLFGAVKNEGIGIPETPNTKNIGNRKMIGSKPYYKEYALEAGKPVVLEAAAGSPAVWSQTPGFHSFHPGWECAPSFASSFVPQADSDYEVALNIDFRNSVCVLVVNRVGADGQTTPVDVKPAPKHCE
ncbi:hypothetical protein [Xanthomonas sp. MUS 060]|uniref:hypothetical protein n=1 Tax=Xanthomonas sp. MUS 060 TaxID=1588031 RepID=UPI0005F2E73B|nr:hypothetical protein [Xanthomonas sp. MUS 060]